MDGSADIETTQYSIDADFCQAGPPKSRWDDKKMTAPKERSVRSKPNNIDKKPIYGSAMNENTKAKMAQVSTMPSTIR